MNPDLESQLPIRCGTPYCEECMRGYCSRLMGYRATLIERAMTDATELAKSPDEVARHVLVDTHGDEAMHMAIAKALVRDSEGTDALAIAVKEWLVYSLSPVALERVLRVGQVGRAA